MFVWYWVVKFYFVALGPFRLTNLIQVQFKLTWPRLNSVLPDHLLIFTRPEPELDNSNPDVNEIQMPLAPIPVITWLVSH